MATHKYVFRPPGEVLRRYYYDRSPVSIITGPLGSGKTTATCYKILSLMMEQEPNKMGTRPTRCIAIRNTFGELLSTTAKDFITIFEDLGTFKQGGAEPPSFKMRFQLPDKTIVDHEMIFIALDRPQHVKKLRGHQVTWFWLSEVKELPKEVVDMADLRHGRYPSMQLGEVLPTYSGMIGDTNQCDEDHWLYEFQEVKKPAGELPDWSFFVQPGGVIKRGGRWEVNPLAENVKNLPDGYYSKRIQGKADDWIKVNLANEYGFVMDGRPVHPEYTDSIHAVDDVDYLPDNTIVLGFDFGRCYDDKTEVLTISGWKYFKDVDAETDVVATMNPETRAFEYTKINFKTEYDYDGDMLYWEGVNIDLCVTPEHRFPYTRRDSPDELRWASAEEVAREMSAHRYAIVAPRRWVGREYNNNPLSMSPIDYAEFLGWWMADGFVEKETNRVVISQIKKSEHLDLLMERMGSRYGISPIKNNKGWRFSSKELADHLRIFGGKHVGGRRVPDSIMFGTRDIIRSFVMAYTYGDGHIRKPRGNTTYREHTIWFRSKELAGQFQDLGQKLGWGSSLYKAKATRSTFRDGRVVCGCSGWTVCFKKKWERVELKQSQFSRKHYRGKIYCLNVPYHTLCVRRNGKVSWNGNTPACAILQQIGDTWYCLDEFVTEDMSAAKFGPHLKNYLAREYPGCGFIGWGDPAGAHKGEVVEHSAIETLNAIGIPCEPCETQDPLQRRAAVSHPLTELGVGGKPRLLICKKAKTIRKGLAGKFCYRRLQVAGDEKYMDVPDKNKWSHPVEALEYALLGEGEGVERLINASIATSDDERMAVGY